MDRFVVVYIDDLLIFSKAKDEHLKSLELGLERLENHELYIGKTSLRLCKIMLSFLD